MAILNSYVKLPEGNYSHEPLFWMMCFLLETLASTFICWGSLTTGLKYPRIQGIIHSINTNHRLQKIPASAKRLQSGTKKHQFLKLSMLHTLQHGNTICLKPSFFKLFNPQRLGQKIATTPLWRPGGRGGNRSRLRWVMDGRVSNCFPVVLLVFNLWISTSSYYSTYPRINEDICGNPVLLQSE